MHYFLKQVLPDSDPGPPIKVHLHMDAVYVGRKQFKSLTRFPQISRKHAVFYKSDDGNVFVKDLNSTNGVYVNDTRIGSSLKQLKSGDEIGFGVASSGAAEGFICVLCTEDVVELEIIDDEDDKSSKISNFETPVKRQSSLNTTEVSSQGDNNAYLPDIYEIPSASKHQNMTKISHHRVKKGESSSRAKNGVTYDNSNSNLSEPSSVRSASLPQDDFENVQGEPLSKGEARSPKRIVLPECFIRLVRCDDSSFQFPPDVRNPFRTGQIKLRLQRTKSTKQRGYSKKAERISHSRRKRTGKLNTDSSDNSDEYVPQSAISTVDSADSSADSSVDSDEVKAQSKAPRTRYSVNNKHRRKRFRNVSTDSSDDSEECQPRISRSRTQHNKYSFISSSSSNDSEYTRPRTRSKTRRTTDLPSNKRPRKRSHVLSSESSCDSDKNADLASNNHKRKQKRNSSSVSSDGPTRIVCARTSSKTRLEADASTSNHDCRANSTNKGSLPRDPDPGELNCERSSSKTKGNQDDEAGGSYSQPDIFYISDSEIYLDVTSSVLIKQEPESNSESDTCKEIFGREDSYSPTPKTTAGYSDDRIESIESIKAFIQEPKNSDPATRDRVVQVNNSALPSSSRDTDGETSTESHSDASIRSNDGDSTGPTKNNKEIRKSSGRTLLTDPKPLTYMPRKFRGRDENFVERKKQQIPLPKPKKPGENGTHRSESNNSKFDDYNPPAKKRISHFTSKASTSKSSFPSSAPTGSFPPARPLADVVEKNRVGIERTVSSQGHATSSKYPSPAKNKATNLQRPTVDHHRLPAHLEGSNGVVGKLLQMNTVWLKEQAMVRKPPPAVSEGAALLPATFDSHASYVALFRPLIVLEIWERLFAEWREVETDGGRNCKFQFVVVGHTKKKGCVELQCESVRADRRPGPRVGDMAVLDVKEGPPHSQCTPVFGYVLEHDVELLGPDYALGDTPWKQLSEDWRSDSVPKRWTFRACVKRKRETPSFDQHSLMKGYNLGCIRHLLGWADALNSIRVSPLLDTLLRPAPCFALPAPQRHLPMDQENRYYTSEQEAFIRNVCDTVVRRAADPDVFLLGGAPGTGKTHVIVGIIERLLYRRSAGDIRVLVAAPGDTAIDEIGRRLIRLSRRYEGNSVRFVRLGNESQVDRLMLPYCVSKVVGVSGDEAEVLSRSHVVLSSLSGLVADHQFRPSICIVDDATQCTEPDALLAAATGAPLLVLVGDPYQRAPGVVSRSARNYGLERSLFERVMLSRPAHALCEQIRMHEEISRYPCPSSRPSSRRVRDLGSLLRPYLVLDLPDDENPFPVEVVCEFVCSADPLASIAALVAPSSRRVRFRADASPLLRRHARRVEVRGPDGFLGREKDVVVLWAAITCPMRLRAALTRARRCLIVCVAGEKMVRAKNDAWAQLLADAEKRGVLCVAPPDRDRLRRVLSRRLLVQPR